jgi:pyruvate/2-oxoglutarate dehydrogenase complex dihydrolipoamide dehydrogenase (E3) component
MVHLGAEIISAHEEPGGKVLDIRVGTEARSVTCDEILVAVGRAPNIDGMNLEAAGIEYDRAGIKVDDFLRTSNNDVYAAGDVCMKHKFTHAADQAARIVIRNALFHGRARLSRSVIPWCTYTDPEIAHAGVYEGAEDSQGRAVDTVRVDASMCDRAVTDGTPEGFIKVHLRKGKDEILGATIVSPHAGDLIGYISAAMTTGLRLSAFARTVFPYPTHSELLKKAADAHSRSRLTPKIRSLLRWWFEWKR